MGVLAEAESVVIRNATVESRLPGGMQEYEQRCPNGMFCTDGQICRVGFMVPADARSYIDDLGSLGLVRPTSEGSPEVALINQETGFVFPCDWLELTRIDLGGDTLTTVAWVRGTELTEVVAPPHWKPGRLIAMTSHELGENLEFLGTQEGVDVFRDKATGELRYAGRTQEGAPPAHLAQAMIQERFSSLSDELTRLGAMEQVPAGEYRGDLASLHERAKRLVEDTQSTEPGPLHLQGMAARLLGRWDEAASLFGRVTELRPEYRSGWLELTWALTVLRRFEDAERAARTAVNLAPEDPAAVGNLAAVLLEQGKIDEARSTAEKALLADPADAKNKAILAAAERAASGRGLPWSRRSKARRDGVHR